VASINPENSAMGCAVEYRQFAEQQRSAANEAKLPLVRQLHLEAAERWQQLAEEQELFERPTKRVQDMFY